MHLWAVTECSCVTAVPVQVCACVLVLSHERRCWWICWGCSTSACSPAACVRVASQPQGCLLCLVLTGCCCHCMLCAWGGALHMHIPRAVQALCSGCSDADASQPGTAAVAASCRQVCNLKQPGRQAMVPCDLRHRLCRPRWVV